MRGGGDDDALKTLVQEHFDKTGSQRARTLLEDLGDAAPASSGIVAPRENMAAIEAANEGADS